MSAIRPAAVIILAAGEGTRMKSATPKVLHQICGQSMLDYVLAAARELDPEEIIVVAGHRRDEVQRHLAEHAPDARVVIQDRQGGTGHAVRMAVEETGLERGMVVVTYGDTPVLRGRTLAALVRQHAAEQAAATVLTAVLPDPTGYGRIIRDEAGGFTEIVEESEATLEQRAITEFNSGMYAFDARLLADSVKRLPTSNAKGEEYLTDAVIILRADGHHVASFRMADPAEAAGVNDRAQLAQARHAINQRLLAEWMRSGVSVVDPATTMVDAGVSIGPDSEIGPGTQLHGRTEIGAGARVGPGCLLRDTTVGEGATVIHAVCESAVIGPGVTVGPFAHLTPGTVVKSPDREPPGGMGAAARGTQRSEGVQPA